MAQVELDTVYPFNPEAPADRLNYGGMAPPKSQQWGSLFKTGLGLAPEGNAALTLNWRFVHEIQ